MTPKNEKQYFAFISYKRDDQKWAKWLQEKLEHYKLPTNLNGRTDLPKDIRPVFRDKSELAAGVLADEITRALEQSKYLILICSRNSAKSEWVNKEVQTFIDMGRTDMIIPFIIEDTVNSGITALDCFPQALKDLPSDKELLGVNINEMGRDAAAVKVVAHMFGLRFDDLWQRHERERKRRRLLVTSGIVLFALAVLGVACWIAHKNVLLRQQKWEMSISQSKLVAEMIKSNSDKNSYLGRKIALEILPKSVDNAVEWPYTPEAELALRNISMHNSAILKGHTDEVISAVYSPNGKQILSASSDSTLRIWDAETGDLVKTFKRNTWRNYNAKFSPDGERIICSDGNIIRILDAETGAEIRNIHNDWYVLSVKFTPDGKQIYATSGDNIIRVLNVTTGELIRTISMECDYFASVSLSHDGKKLACVPAKQGKKYSFRNSPNIDFSDSAVAPVKILDFATGKELKTLNGHKHYVSSVEFSPDDKNILTASYDMTLKIWDAATGKELKSMRGNNSSFFFAVYSCDGKKVAGISPSTDKPIIIWDAATGKELKALAGHLSDVTSADFSLDGKQLLTASSDKTIRMWDVDFNNEANVFARNKNLSINWEEVLCPDGKYIISSNDGKNLIVTNVETGEEVATLPHNDYVYSTAFSNDGNVIVSAAENKLFFWDAVTGEKIRTVDENTEGINTIAFNPKGRVFVTTSFKDFSVRIWDAKTGKEINKLATSNDYVNKTVYSPDGKYIVISVPNYAADMILDSETGTMLGDLSGHVAEIMNTAYSPDGKLLATASFDFTIKIWDAKTMKEIKTLTEPTDVVMYVAFSSDGEHLVAACGDNLVRVWDTKTWNCIWVLEGHTHGVKFASFTPDGRHIISAAQDSTIRKWEFPPLQELIDQTRNRFGRRPLTDDELKQYYLK